MQRSVLDRHLVRPAASRGDAGFHAGADAEVRVDDELRRDAGPGVAYGDALRSFGGVCVVEDARLRVEQMGGDRRFPAVEAVSDGSSGVGEVRVDIARVRGLEEDDEGGAGCGVGLGLGELSSTGMWISAYWLVRWIGATSRALRSLSVDPLNATRS